MTSQDVADARLISGARALEPPQYICVESYRDKLLRIVRLWPPATNKLARTTMIGRGKPLLGQFGDFIIFVRFHDMTINLS